MASAAVMRCNMDTAGMGETIVTGRVRTDETVGDVERLPPGEGLRRAFGAWAEDAEQLDAFLAEIRRSRQRCRREVEP